MITYSLPAQEGTFLETVRETGRVRFPRAGLVTLLPGGLGIASAGMMTGLRSVPLDWDSGAG